MADSLESLAYEASLHSLDKQERVLSELRARTGLLLAASSLAATFLGPAALEDANRLLVGLVLTAFGLSIAASLYVLLPASDLHFSLSGRRLYERLYEHREDVDDLKRRVSYELDDLWEENDVVMGRLARGTRLAAIGLCAELGLLLLAVGGTLF